MKVFVKKGESLRNVAKLHYGDEESVKELAERNQLSEEWIAENDCKVEIDVFLTPAGKRMVEIVRKYKERNGQM